MSNGFTIPKACKIEGVVARENTRHAIMGVQVNAERKSLIATDGRILLELPVADMNGETTAVVPTEAFKALRKGRGGRLRLRCDGAHAIVGGNDTEVIFYVLEGPFPDVATVLDAAPDAGNADVVLGIDAKLLARLAAGMGTDSVVLRTRTTDRHVKTVISVTPLNRDKAPVPDARGAIMPVNVKP